MSTSILFQIQSVSQQATQFLFRSIHNIEVERNDKLNAEETAFSMPAWNLPPFNIISSYNFAFDGHFIARPQNIIYSNDISFLTTLSLTFQPLTLTDPWKRIHQLFMFKLQTKNSSCRHQRVKQPTTRKFDTQKLTDQKAVDRHLAMPTYAQLITEEWAPLQENMCNKAVKKTIGHMKRCQQDWFDQHIHGISKRNEKPKFNMNPTHHFNDLESQILSWKQLIL